MDTAEREDSANQIQSRIQQHPSIYTLSMENQRLLRSRETVIRHLIELRKTHGHILHGERKRACQLLGLGWRMIDYDIQRYLDYATVYPDEPTVNVFVPLPSGRKRGSIKLTKDQQSVIRFAMLERKRVTVYNDKTVKTVPDYTFELFDIYRYAKTVCKDLPSYDTVRRYINDFRTTNPALFKYFIEGPDALARDSVLKRRNDVKRPNQRWQSDIRYLPFYILMDRQPVPVSLVIIYDDFTRLIIAWKLVLNAKYDEQGVLRASHVTTRDICEVFAQGLLATGVRPDEFYTDNGSQYIAFGRVLERLYLDPPTRCIHTRPHLPWGKGKTENGLGQVTKLLRRIADGYRSTRSRTYINQARKSARLSLQELESEFQAHFEYVNTTKPKTRPSRASLWNTNEAQPALTIRELIHLDVEHYSKPVRVTDWGINTLSTTWEPALLGVESRDLHVYKAWNDATTATQYNPEQRYPLWAIRVLGTWHAEVGINDTWIVLTPKQAMTKVDLHMWADGQSIKALAEIGQAYIEEGRTAILRLAGGEPGRQTIDGEYIPAHDVAAHQREQEQTKVTKQNTTTSTKTGRKKKEGSSANNAITPVVIIGFAEAMRDLDDTKDASKP